MIVVGADHGGVALKEALVATLRERGEEVLDVGTTGKESVDYPDYARAVAEKVSRGEAARGVLVCTNGIGMSIAANKYPGVRAALVGDATAARMAREHNDANVLVMALEEEYDMEISDEEAEKIRTVQDVVNYIESHK